MACALVVCAWLTESGSAWATNSISIESKSVTPGANAETVGVYISNDLTIEGFALPLIVRSIDPGAFATGDLSISAGGRLLSWYPYGVWRYARRYTMEGVFGGSKTSCPLDSLGHTWDPSDSITGALASPEALIYAMAQSNDTVGFESGVDSLPSLRINFGTTAARGSFEIDTTCIPPSNHMIWRSPNRQIVVPEFQKAVIDIGGPFWAGDSLHGSIASDLVLRRDVFLSGDVTVDSGVTLTILRNANVRVAAFSDQGCGGMDTARVEIIVRGTLKIDDATGIRPTISADSNVSGAWYGIRVMPGGHFETGIGATIQNAVVGVSVELYAPADTLSNLAVRHCQTGIRNGGGAVALCQDTVIGIPGSTGILADSAAPLIKSCVIESCGTGIKARFSSSTIRDTKIFGPGSKGIEIDDDVLLQQGARSPGLVHAASGEPDPSSRITISRDTVSGYFSTAQLYMAWGSGTCIIDSSGFVHPPGSARSPYGLDINIEDSAWVRHSTISGYSSYGVYCYRGRVDLGNNLSSLGNNSILTDSSGCSGCTLKRVYRASWGTDTLKAEGNWWGTSSPSSAWFSAKVDWNPYLDSPPTGKIVAPEENGESAALPKGFTLSQNYPNPFNAGTQIEFSLATAQKVEVKVYNILGQVVRVLANDRMEAGRHTVIWDGRNRDGEVLASGVYLYRLVAGDFAETKKMVLLK